MNDKIGRFGILTCNLIDSLSRLIDKISISYNNKYNSIGFYYINENGDYNIILFDLYDSYHIKWTTSHCKMSHFISSLYVMNIDFYSFDNENKNLFPSIYNTDILKYDKYDNYHVRHIKSKLEDKFTNIISGLLISYNYERNYNNLLLNIVNNKKSGEELINKILILLLDNYNVNQHFTDSIKNSLSFNINKSTNYINIIDNNFEDIINDEIFKLKDNFHKIYTDHKILLNVDISTFTSNSEFIKITNGYNHIDNLNIKYIDLKNLGYWLNEIINSNNKLEQNSAVKNMITIYNNLIIDSNIKQININKYINIILNAYLIETKYSSKEIISVIRSNIETKNETDLSILSYIQLFDILIYIDSLRDSNGFSDNRFSGIQNLITIELNNRTKLKKS